MRLETAISHCFIAHKGQVDKCGVEYWKHPIIVAFNTNRRFLGADQMGNDQFNDDLAVIALLHDIMEDCPTYSLPVSSIGGEDCLNENQLEALVAITRISGETYKNYIKRLAKNPLALRVKLCDLEHNMSPERHDCIEHRKSLMERYQWARDYLNKKLNNGF